MQGTSLGSWRIAAGAAELPVWSKYRSNSAPPWTIMDFPMRDRFHWARPLAFVTGLVNQELPLRNEYLGAENQILRAKLTSRLRLTDPERSTLAEIAKRLGRKALEEVACVA